MDQGSSPSMPSLWVFLVIVLAVLLGVVFASSFVMHMIQRRQRKQLQRRIARGEVDLETLGIKRLNVPPEEVDKMPLYAFKSRPEGEVAQSAQVAGKDNTTGQLFQPTCSICLDDFVFDETQVRELPCKHIFHPECIDPFLKENSSLCPLCKRSALPPGYCPIEVTNVMVRRERMTRRTGHPLPPRQYARYQAPPPPTTWSRRLDRIRGPSVVSSPRAARVHDAGPVHGIAEEIPENRSTHEDTELGPVQSQPDLTADLEEPPIEVARRGTMARRAWRRERLASRHAIEYNEQAEQARRIDERRPLWRRIVGVA